MPRHILLPKKLEKGGALYLIDELGKMFKELETLGGSMGNAQKR